MIAKLLFLQAGTGNRGKYFSLLSNLLLRNNSRRLPKNVMRETGRCIVVGSLNFTENSCYLCADQFETSTSPPPGHTPGIWLCIVSGERGIWTFRWKGGEFEPDLSLVLTQYTGEFFRFLQGLTDLQDRMSPLLVNNSLKRVFKRSLKVSLRPISLLKTKFVFEER